MRYLSHFHTHFTFKQLWDLRFQGHVVLILFINTGKWWQWWWCWWWWWWKCWWWWCWIVVNRRHFKDRSAVYWRVHSTVVWLSSYDKVPHDFAKMNDDITSSVNASCMLLSMCATVSRLLHHRRWIWSMQGSTNSPLSIHCVGRILSHLAK